MEQRNQRRLSRNANFQHPASIHHPQDLRFSGNDLRLSSVRSASSGVHPRPVGPDSPTPAGPVAGLGHDDIITDR